MRLTDMTKLFPVLNSAELTRLELDFVSKLQFGIVLKPEDLASFCDTLCDEKVHPDILRIIGESEYLTTLMDRRSRAPRKLHCDGLALSLDRTSSLVAQVLGQEGCSTASSTPPQEPARRLAAPLSARAAESPMRRANSTGGWTARSSVGRSVAIGALQRRAVTPRRCDELAGSRGGVTLATSIPVAVGAGRIAPESPRQSLPTPPSDVSPRHLQRSGSAASFVRTIIASSTASGPPRRLSGGCTPRTPRGSRSGAIPNLAPHVVEADGAQAGMQGTTTPRTPTRGGNTTPRGAASAAVASAPPRQASPRPLVGCCTPDPKESRAMALLGRPLTPRGVYAGAISTATPASPARRRTSPGELSLNSSGRLSPRASMPATASASPHRRGAAANNSVAVGSMPGRSHGAVGQHLVSSARSPEADWFDTTEVIALDSGWSFSEASGQKPLRRRSGSTGCLTTGSTCGRRSAPGAGLSQSLRGPLTTGPRRSGTPCGSRRSCSRGATGSMQPRWL